MNESINESIVEKIRKMLALAADERGNKNMAEIAILKAQELAQKHDIDIKLISIATKTVKQSTIDKTNINLGSRKSITQKWVSSILNSYFNVRCIYSGNRKYGMYLALIGTKENCEIAQFVNGFLNETFLRLWRDYYQTNPVELNERDSFLKGLTAGLSEKLKSEKQQIELEKLSNQSGEVKQEFALMVVNEKERVNQAVTVFYPSLRTNYAERNAFKKPVNYDTFSSGVTIGKTITINRAIGAGSACQAIAA